MNAIPRLAPMDGVISRDFPLQRLVIVTDAWRPQVNGVVRTIEMLAAELTAWGIVVTLITPEPFKSFGLPTYPEIRLALASPQSVGAMIEGANPDAVHIATEGPLGLAAAWYSRSRGRPFTTCFHTRFPEYIASRLPVPTRWSYALLRRFHAVASRTMVATPALAEELARYGFTNLRIWQRGIDLAPFLHAVPARISLPRPLHLYVGRVAVEKNLEAFLSLDLPGSQVIVGDGPSRAQLQAAYPSAHFLGARSGPELTSLYAAADVFVFPSRTDTFGLVMLEALAAGTPVAAFPVAGPREVIGRSRCGCLADDLRDAITQALLIDRQACRQYASGFSMRSSAMSFVSHLDLSQHA